MYNLREWTFIGASGAKYAFSCLAKSEELPQSPGVFILAYAHPKGHMAGWQVHPLLISHAENIHAAFDNGAKLSDAHIPIWNCDLVMLEASISIREKCVQDLQNMIRCE